MTAEPAPPDPSSAARWRRASPYLSVVVAVVLANALYLSGAAIFDPMVSRAHVETSVQAGFVPGGYTLDPNDGFTAQALGAGAARQLVSGRLPWWNALAGVGMPLAAEMQSAAFFPGTLLRLLPQGDLLLKIALELVAGLCTVAVARSLSVRPALAGAAGIVFALNGVFAWLGNAAYVPVAFLPMLVWAIERAARAVREGRAGGTVAVALAIALSLLAGFPETAYLSALLGVAWYGWRVAGARGRRWLLTLRVGGGAALGTGLAAIVVVPFAAYVAGGAQIGGHADVFAHRGLPWGSLGILVTPYAYGPLGTFAGSEVGGLRLYQVWADVGGYTTVALLSVALLGASGARLRGLRLTLAGWVVLTLGKTFALPVVQNLINLVPGVTLSAFYRYADATWIFGLVVLAVLGLEDLARREVRRWRLLAALGVAAPTLVAAGLQARAMVARNADARMHTFLLLSYGYAALTLVAVAVLGWWALHGRTHRRLAVALGVALALEAVGFAVVPTLSSPRGYTADAQLVDFLEQRAQARADGTDLGRIVSLTDRLDPNYGTYFGVAQLNVNDLPVPESWSSLVQSRFDPQADPGNFYVYDLSPTNLARIRQAFADHVQAYRQAGVAYVITGPGGVPESLAGLLQPVLSTRTATVSRLVGAEQYVGSASGGCTVTSRSELVHRVTCASSGTLVRRELAMAGWGVSIDGGAVRPVRTVDDYYQGVDVPAGEHEVTFRYIAPGAHAGEAASAGSALTLALVLVLPAVRRRRLAAASGPRPPSVG